MVAHGQTQSAIRFPALSACQWQNMERNIVFGTMPILGYEGVVAEADARRNVHQHRTQPSPVWFIRCHGHEPQDVHEGDR